MKASDLRKSILQAAVQGKLVPQDKNDEPASELLKRIQSEKAALVRDGELKKEKPLPLITEDEIPYDLPEGWVWSRVGTLSYQVTSGSRGWAKYYSSEGAKFLRMGNLSRACYDLRLSNIQHVYPPEGKEGERTLLQENDILVSITGEVGLLGMIPANFGEAYINQHVAMVRCSQYIMPVYIAKAFLSPLCNEQFNMPQRGIKNSFRLTDLQNILIPIPPLGEQQRIIAKVDELMSLCNELEAAEKEQDALEKHLVETLPKSILQAAVQGKLVPQDKNDEPASELLKQVQAEKAALIKAGKLKKEKPLPPIIEDEIPYDLPDGWVWCRLQDICAYIQRGRSPAYSDIMKYPVISQKCNQWSGFCIAKAKFIAPDSIEKYERIRFIQDNDLLLNSTGTGTLGRIAIYSSSANPYESAVADGHVTVIRVIAKHVLPSYIYHYFSNPSVQNVIEIQADGTTKQKELSLSTVSNYLVPLPPIAEQRRIVAKVNELMLLCDELKHAYDQPISDNNVISLPTVDENDVDEEPLQMAAQGKINAQPSPKHTDALQQLQGMMQDE